MDKQKFIVPLFTTIICELVSYLCSLTQYLLFKLKQTKRILSLNALNQS